MRVVVFLVFGVVLVGIAVAHGAGWAALASVAAGTVCGACGATVWRWRSRSRLRRRLESVPVLRPVPRPAHAGTARPSLMARNGSRRRSA